jgi:uncharacterized protein YwqG
MSEAQLDQLLKPLIKPAVLLSLSQSDEAEAASCVSKFGGLPYAEKNEVWPSCPTCKNDLNFVAQIKHPLENSLYAFFYCFECFPWGMGDEEKGQWLIRSYFHPEMKNYTEIKQGDTQLEYAVAACQCTEQVVQTLPDFETLESLSAQAAALCDADDPYEDYDKAIERCGCLVDYASLIGGYPKWIQGETLKTCPLCHAEMEFFAQLDSENEADIMWGDSGLVYLFRCPEHKNEFALELQCY